VQTGRAEHMCVISQAGQNKANAARCFHEVSLSGRPEGIECMETSSGCARGIAFTPSAPGLEGAAGKLRCVFGLFPCVLLPGRIYRMVTSITRSKVPIFLSKHTRLSGGYPGCSRHEMHARRSRMGQEVSVKTETVRRCSGSERTWGHGNPFRSLATDTTWIKLLSRREMMRMLQGAAFPWIRK
jgi:hypothetical protein